MRRAGLSFRYGWLQAPLACAVLFLAAPLPADETAGESPGLTLGEAVHRTLERHPSLAVSREEVAAATARADAAGLAPAFEVAAEFENFAGSGELAGTDALESTLELSRAIELGGKRERRVAAAGLERELAERDIDVARLELSAETARRFIDALNAQTREVVADESQTIAGEIVTQAERRVAAGLALRAEVQRSSAEAARGRLLKARTAAEADTARQRLAALWGEGTADFTRVDGDLLAVPVVPPVEALLESMAASPKQARLLTERRLREAEVRLADSQNRPDITLSGGVRHVNESNDMGFVAGISVPIGNRSRARPAIAEAQARLRQSEASAALDRIEAEATIRALHQELAARRAAVLILRDEVLPLSESALEQIERGYRLGRLPYSELGTAATAVLETRLELIEEATAFHRLATELEQLTGLSVTTRTGP